MIGLLFNLFSSSLSAVLQILIVVAIGFIIQITEMVSPDMNAMLSRLFFYVFMPCKAFSSVALSINTEDLAAFFLMPFLCITSIGFQYILGRLIFSKKFGYSQLMHQLYLTSSTFGNTITLPLIMSSSLLSSKSIFGSHAQQYANQAVGFVSLYLIPFQVLVWSVGTNLMAPPKDHPLCLPEEETLEEKKDDDSIDSIDNNEEIDSNGDNNNNSNLNIKNEYQEENDNEENQDVTVAIDRNDDEIHYNSEDPIHIRTDSDDTNTTLSEHTPETSDPDEIQLLSPPSSSSSSSRLSLSLSSFFCYYSCQQFYTTIQRKLSRFITPPGAAAVLGIIVGLIHPLRDFLLADSPPWIAWFPFTIHLLGPAAFPCLLIVLGGSLANAFPAVVATLYRLRILKRIPAKYAETASESMSQPMITWKGLGASLAFRYLLMPSVSLMVGLLVYYGLGLNNPPLLMVTFLEGATPPALNLIVITRIHHGYGSMQTASLMFLHYALVMIPLTLWAGVYLFILTSWIS